MIVAHGNSLRAIVKKLINVSDEGKNKFKTHPDKWFIIMDVNLVYIKEISFFF